MIRNKNKVFALCTILIICLMAGCGRSPATQNPLPDPSSIAGSLVSDPSNISENKSSDVTSGAEAKSSNTVSGAGSKSSDVISGSESKSSGSTSGDEIHSTEAEVEITVGSTSLDIKNIIGEGVDVRYIVVSEDAELEITGCPSYGDRKTPYVYGTLTKGDPFAYELITIIIVNGNYFGKKPYNDSPNGFIKADSTFSVQYSSNDGVGTDWNAENIYIFMVPVGFKDGIEPDVGSGYIVPPSQISALKDSSICVVQINREIVIE